jgi:hypothetical protein
MDMQDKSGLSRCELIQLRALNICAHFQHFNPIIVCMVHLQDTSRLARTETLVTATPADQLYTNETVEECRLLGHGTV